MIAQISNAVGGSGLSSMSNMVPDPGKLTIIPVAKFAPVPVPVPLAPYVAMFNPENWQIQENVVNNSDQAIGQVGAPARYLGIGPRKLSFDLIIDGTGASGEKREVLVDVVALKASIGFNGESHQTNRLLVIWGSQIFMGAVESLSIKFTLFRPNGTPLRATVSLGLVEDIEPVMGILKMNLKSSDLTRSRVTKMNDRLDLICYHLYNDSRYYLEVAKANNLTSFRNLPTNTELIYPPTEK
jgi:Contractile injection system tube protein